MLALVGNKVVELHVAHSAPEAIGVQIELDEVLNERSQLVGHYWLVTLQTMAAEVLVINAAQILGKGRLDSVDCRKVNAKLAHVKSVDFIRWNYKPQQTFKSKQVLTTLAIKVSTRRTNRSEAEMTSHLPDSS